ncbi:hypothetical protein R3W88_021242 [Solanum pinnatisectum]|uniref:Uncharacterized protein n=1 Tax=Solanum pinnatisectum TaxID=50273 RepID=A0AAV9LUS7_9SOLN|nr:hypothetical protein R3W88_021242 [Solanum pinnatisectum]
MAHISNIKLIRTDTTLDLSQKAEKGMLLLVNGIGLCSSAFRLSTHWLIPMWDM